MISSEEMNALEELLPFYVKGTISAGDKARVDAALSVSAEFRASLERERALKDRVVSGVNAIADESEGVVAAREALLLARTKVANQPAAIMNQPAEKGGLAKALAFLNPKRWHPAVALSLALAIPAQAAVIANQSSRIAWLEDENFRLASGPCEEKQAVGRILIEVKDDATFTSVSALLEGEGLKITESGGLGMVTIKSDKTGAELNAQIERLRKSPLLSSADPAA